MHTCQTFLAHTRNELQTQLYFPTSKKRPIDDGYPKSSSPVFDDTPARLVSPALISRRNGISIPNRIRSPSTSPRATKFNARIDRNSLCSWGQHRRSTMSTDKSKVESEFGLVTLSEDRPYFTGATSPNCGETFPLSRERSNIIGKKKDVTTICINDRWVARRHCQIVWCAETGNFRVTDIDARNPTAVNGVTLKGDETVSVHPGDEVRCGQTAFRIEELRQSHSRGI